MTLVKKAQPQRQNEQHCCFSWGVSEQILGQVHPICDSVPNHFIDDDLLKEYFSKGQHDNYQNVLDTIAGGSYGECTYDKNVEKLEKMSCNNKAWNTRKSDAGRNTFAVQAIHNPVSDDIREDMTQMELS